MGALPEDDAPTMTGTPGDKHVDHPANDGDDTTTAEAGPPAGPPAPPPGDGHDGHDAEDRTVQQKVSAPTPRRPPPVPSRPPSPVPSRPPSRPDDSARMKAVPPAPATARGPGTSTSETNEEIEELDDVEDIEDSITAAAPRMNAHLPGLTIPGSIRISSVEHDDDLADETEVRTRPGNMPLEISATLRASAELRTHGSSQPLPPPRPAAGVPASAAPPSTAPREDDEDDDDDGVTTEAPAPRVGSVPDLAASIGILPKSSGPTTDPVPSGPITQPAVSEPVATTRPRASSLVADSAEEPATRPGVATEDEPPTRPGIGGDAPSPPRKSIDDGYANDGDDDESVTARGHVVEPYEDQSVTAQDKAVSERILATVVSAQQPAGRAGGINDATLDDGTTQKVRKTIKSAAELPADSESESITTQAPGPLTNILRVIASDSSPAIKEGALPRLEDDEPPENRTAVMANAPLKRVIDALGGATAMASGSVPAIRPTGPPLTLPQGSSGRSSAAPRLAPTSESGLRVARAPAQADRASLGAVGVAEGSHSGTARTAANESANGSIDPRAATIAAFPQPEPSLHDVDLGRGPRYGLLVAIVAVMSFVVPVTLFVFLRGRPEELTPGVPAQAASEFEKHDPPRGKLDKKAAAAASASAAAAAASASASAAASASAHRPPVIRPPFNRR